MITKNGKELLNLENTVGKLVELVEGHYEVDRVIADYGITMVNQRIDNPSQLEGIRGTKWGEAYPVGYEPPYDIYIWTRPTVDTTNVADGAWFNVGKMAIPGPVGPAGESIIGPRGENVRWFIGSSLAETADPRIGDLYLMDDNSAVPGDVYMYTENGWGLPRTNIRGSQGRPGVIGPKGDSIVGPTGPIGPKGDTAPVITLIGIVSSPDDFDEPTASLIGRGYVLQQDGINTVYTVIETEPGVYDWQPAGAISGFSVITANNGQVQTMWNADTKLNNITYTPTSNVVPVIQANSREQSWAELGFSATPYTVPQRSTNGEVAVGTPTADAHATTKKYVDYALAGKVTMRTNSTTYPQMYEKTKAGGLNFRDLIPDVYSPDTWDAHGYTVAQRDNYGAVRGPDPTDANQYTTKSYTEANFSKKLYQHNLIVYGTGPDSDENMWSFGIVFSYLSSSPTKITSYWSIHNALTKNGTQPITFCPKYGYIDGENIIRATLNSSGWQFEVGEGANAWGEYVVFFRDGEYAESNGSVDDTVSPIL